MNHASGAIATADTEAVQVDDAIWQRAKRCPRKTDFVGPLVVVFLATARQATGTGKSAGGGSIPRTGGRGGWRPVGAAAVLRRGPEV